MAEPESYPEIRVVGYPGWHPRDICVKSHMTQTPSQTERSGTENRLARETSPYLLQHKDNPVQWRPWGNEAALDEAKRLDGPVLLSIGYAACHWCHVMAHESFEDPGAIAALMNDLFVSIKVDREERPDIDALYQAALAACLASRGAGRLRSF